MQGEEAPEDVMDRTIRLTAFGAGLLAVVLAVVYGPVLTGYVFAGVALAVILTLMAMESVHAIEDWLLDHQWTLRRRSERTRAR